MAQEPAREHYEESYEHYLIADQRVQREFHELSQLLEQIGDFPVNDSSVVSDPAWRIDDFEVSRWVISLEGSIQLDRVAAFRERLIRRDDVIDARVDSLQDGQINIRLVTTGGIPMGPLERAVSDLNPRQINHTTTRQTFLD